MPINKLHKNTNFFAQQNSDLNYHVWTNQYETNNLKPLEQSLSQPTI